MSKISFDGSGVGGCGSGESLQLYQSRDGFIPQPPHSGAWYHWPTTSGYVFQGKSGTINKVMTSHVWVDDDGSIWADDDGNAWFAVD
jgi:hypothetical protein